MIDTDFARNIQHIRPYLGVLLVASVALGFALMINNAAKQLTQNIYTEVPKGIEGSLSIKNHGTLHYGDTVSYKSKMSGVSVETGNTYITTVCFQGDNMVFQRSVQQGVPIHLYDQIIEGLDWDGGAASCSATLMYRTISGGSINVYVVDSISFDVLAREY
jgi:hypothetical protein